MDSSAKPPQEIELKLALEPALLASVRRHPAVAPLLEGRARTVGVVSRYYDTPDRRLQKSGVTLRLRRAGRRWLQTAKGEGSAVAGLHQRIEYEWPLARPLLDAALLATTRWKKLFATVAGDLKPVFTTDIRRTSQALVFADGTRAKLCLDVGTIRAGPRRAAISEIEIEWSAGDTRHLYELAQALAADLPVRVAHLSKAERGYTLAGGGTFEPIRASRVPMAAEHPGRDGFCRRGCGLPAPDWCQCGRHRRRRRRGIRAPASRRRKAIAIAAQILCHARSAGIACGVRPGPAVARQRRRGRARLGRLRGGNLGPDRSPADRAPAAPRPGTAQGARHQATRRASGRRNGGSPLAARDAPAARSGRHARQRRGAWRERRCAAVGPRPGRDDAGAARSATAQAQQAVAIARAGRAASRSARRQEDCVTRPSSSRRCTAARVPPATSRHWRSCRAR